VFFKRNLHFILLGNKGTGKTTLAKVLTNQKLRRVEPTKEITKYKASFKLESSKNSSLLTLERYRKYQLNIIDVPGSFEDRREWREAFKKGKKPYAICLVIDPFQSLPESQSTLEDVYNRYLESLSNDIDKADSIARELPLLIVIVMNKFSNKGEFDENRFYEDALKETITIIRKKLPLVFIDVVKVNIKNKPINYYEINAIIEKIKRFYYPD
jgi:GTPase SAR1 family protein